MRYLCFDIESCDGGRGGSLCSFGYCIADENFNIIKQEDILVNPKKAFNKRLFGSVIKLAYSEEQFRASPKFPEVYRQIADLFNDVTVVGFSVLNDVNYLADSIRAYGLKQIHYEFYDVQLMYGIAKKENKSYSLSAAAEEYGIEFLEHRSVDDAVATLKVLNGLLKQENKTFTEFIDKYAVIPGRIGESGIHTCYTDIVYSKIDYDSEKLRRKLVSEHVLSQKYNRKYTLPLAKKVFCFDDELEIGDINLSRDIISAIYALGGRYTSGAANANVFVYDTAGSPRYNYAKATVDEGHRMTFMQRAEFMRLLGQVERHDYDDAAILQASNRRRRLYKERLKDVEARQRGEDLSEHESKPRKRKRKHRSGAVKNEGI